MPTFLELVAAATPPAGKAIVVDTKGHHYSNDPIPVERAKAQMRAIEAARAKKRDSK